MAQIKAKIGHFLHRDKADKETTPGASPGYADLDTVPANTTTNIPEAFFPGSKPVIAQETHSTAPYTGALGTSVPGASTNGATSRQPPAVPQDSAAMLGVPPSGGHRTSPQPEETPLTPLSSQTDRGTGGNAEQTPGTGKDIATPGREDPVKELPLVPASDVKTVDSPVTKSDFQGKNYAEKGPEEDVQEKDYRGSDFQGKNYAEEGPEEDVQEKDYRGSESEGEPKNHPGSIFDVESTEEKPEDEYIDSTPEESNLEDNSSY